MISAKCRMVLGWTTTFFLLINTGNAADSSPETQNDDAHIQELVERAFKAATIEQLPLSTSQIDRFQEKMDDTAQAVLPAPKPNLISRTQNVSLEPGAKAVSINLAPGYVTSIVIMDSTGAPWPITTDTVGNKSWFSVVKPETEAGNMLTVNALKNHVTSNLAVTLKGRDDTPLIVELIMQDSNTDKKPQDADMIVSMRMNKPGPNATPPVVGAKVGSSISSDIMSFLDGVPVTDASPLKLQNQPDGVQAWSLNNQLYLRSSYLARWPAWIQEARSSDGTHIYVMPMSNQIILSVDGESQPVTVVQ